MLAIDYPVRTPPAYWPVVALIVALCYGGLAYIHAGGPGLLLHGGWTLLLLTALMALIPPVYLLTTREYRVCGTIRVSVDAIEVPDADGRPLRFDPRTAQLQLTRVTVRYSVAAIPVADIRRGTVIDLRSGPLRRRLSTLTLVHQDHTAALLDDLERVRRGEPPRGPYLRSDVPPPPPRPQSDLESQLDRELAALD
jgi:hypothetical protein